MVGIGTLKYYNNLYRLRRKGLQFSKAYQTKLYNWFPPFFEQDLWLPKFIEGRGLLKDKPGWGLYYLWSRMGYQISTL